jgi:5-methylcytosine-specific restriction enzyme A
MAEDWTDAELDSAVATYLAMLGHQSRNEAYSKTSYRNQALAGPLAGRSEASFEFRMRNISHVIETALHSGWVVGYRPAANVGPEPTRRILAALERQLGGGSTSTAPTFDATQLSQRTEAARTRAKRSHGTLRPMGNSTPRARSAETTVYERDPGVKGWVLEYAKGVCEACGKPGPFKTKAGDDFLEVHHVKKLAEGGPDTIENAIAVCPNCHREAHIGPDVPGWSLAVYERIRRLRR